MYWVIQTKVPVAKVSILGKLLKKQKNFAGTKITNDHFENNQATIQVRFRSTEESKESKYPSDMLLFLNTFGGRIYHTTKNKDTWKYAHSSPNIKQSNSKDKYLTNVLEMSEKAVLILGKDTEDELLDIMMLRNAFAKRGYIKSTFLKVIEDVPTKSLSQKVQFWALASRFCIMVDVKPAGHLAEFAILKNLDVILAIVHPKKYRSSYMIDINPSNKSIREFEFDKSPLECLENVIQWAEDRIRKNESHYRGYPWRILDK